MNGDRFRELRARVTSPAVVRALDLKPSVDGHACPRCGARFELHDDQLAGVSVRCISSRCAFSPWAWPEFMLAELRGITNAEAERQLLTSAGSTSASSRTPSRSPRSARAVKALDRILGAA